MIRSALIATVATLSAITALACKDKPSSPLPGATSTATSASKPADAVANVPGSAAADATSAPQVDVDAATAHVFELWHDGKLQAIYDEAHPEFRKRLPLAVLQRIHDLIGDAGGAFTKLGTPLEHSHDNDDLVVKGPAIYEHGTMTFTVGFRVVDGKPLVDDFNLAVPKELEVTPDLKDAEALTRKMLDAMLAAKIPIELVDPSVLATISDPAPLQAKLKTIDDAIGKVKSVKLLEQHPCGGQCITYEVTGSKLSALGTFEARFRIRRWQIRQFELIPKQPK